MTEAQASDLLMLGYLHFLLLAAMVAFYFIDRD